MNIHNIEVELQRRLSKEAKLGNSFTSHVRPIPTIVCANGVKLSVQASASHYCTPRENDGPYYAVEVGFPSVEIPEFLEYAEDPGHPTETVYGWVPLSLVAQTILNFGGFAQK